MHRYYCRYRQASLYNNVRTVVDQELEGRTQRPLYELATDMYQPHTGLKSMMTILRIFERLESSPEATKRVKNSAAEGIRIFVKSGLEKRLIVKTTVRFFDHLECPFI